MNRTIVRLGAATLASAVLLTPVAASAHITVSSPDASREGFGKVVVRVPNESDTAGTVKVRLTLPAEQPLAYVSVQPKTDWTVKVEKAKLDEPVTVGDARISEAVRTITWSTRGDGIKPGEFDEFALSGGPLPDVKEMTFDAQQTYADGEVVDWDQVQKGTTEPEHPAPVLSLAAATTDDADTVSSTVEPASAPTSDGGSDVPGRILAIVAVVLAVAALVVSLRRSRA